MLIPWGMIFARTLAVAAAALMLQGCLAGFPQQESTGNETLLAEQIRVAREREAAGDIPQALFHWRVASTLAPGENRVEDNLRRLRLHRLAEAKRLREAGRRDLSRGRTGKARLTLLRALALDPFDRDTLEHLRRLEQRVLDRQMTAKIARSREALDFRQTELPRSSIADNTDRRHAALKYPADDPGDLSTQPPGHRAQQKELVELHLRRASDRFEQRRFDAALQEITQAEALAGNDPDLGKSVRSLRREFAEKLYASGIRLASSDPHKARELLRQTLRFEPGNAKAAIRIRRLPSP